MDKEEIPLKQIRTFQGDVAEALKKQEESLVSIQRAEAAKRPARPEPVPQSKRREAYIFFTIASVALFLLGAGGIWFAYNEFINRTVTPPSAVPDNRFIIARSVEEIDVATFSRESLLSAVSSSGSESLSTEPTHIILENGPDNLLTSSEFMDMLESHAPGNLVRSFQAPFMFGALGQNQLGGTSRFIIFRLLSYENAFAGMLDWEDYMAEDIGPLFGTAPLLRDIFEATTTPEFVDLTDKNKDMRVLRTPNGQNVLFYSFYEDNAVVITDSLESMHTLIDRLVREKFSR